MSALRSSVWNPDEQAVREQITLSRVDNGDGTEGWIAEDMKRPGCWAGGQRRVSALAALDSIRGAWDVLFDENGERRTSDESQPAASGAYGTETAGKGDPAAVDGGAT